MWVRGWRSAHLTTKELPQALPMLLGESLGPHSLGACLGVERQGPERGKEGSRPESWSSLEWAQEGTQELWG